MWHIRVYGMEPGMFVGYREISVSSVLGTLFTDLPFYVHICRADLGRCKLTPVTALPVLTAEWHDSAMCVDETSKGTMITPITTLKELQNVRIIFRKRTDEFAAPHLPFSIYGSNNRLHTNSYKLINDQKSGCGRWVL